MNDITLQEAAHKNVVLWRLMQKLGFCAAKKKYDINRRTFVISLGRPVDEEIGHFCKQFYFDSKLFHFDRLKFLDNTGNAHIYEITDYRSYLWQARSEFNFFPITERRAFVYARAELLDCLVKDFSYGLKWKKEKLMCKFEEIAQACIDIDLNFNSYSTDMEKSIIDTVYFHEHWQVNKHSSI